MDTNETYPSMKLYTSVCVLLDERTTQRDDLLAAAKAVLAIGVVRDAFGQRFTAWSDFDKAAAALRAAIAKAEEAKQ